MRKVRGKKKDDDVASRSNADSVEGGDGKSLPASLKSGVEQLSGQDLSDVTVHRNSSKPAQLQAEAYAQGSDIHLSPGKEMHLPHETWHVAQQKQGRVAQTRQMKGQGINDDPKLEREADVMGAKANALQAKGLPGASPVVGAANSSNSAVPIQRKMGFEFETGGNKLVGFDRKEVAYRGNGFTLESDTKNNMEFVTQPYNRWGQLGGAIRRASALANQLAGERDRRGEVRKDAGGGWQQDGTRMRIGDRDFRASVQLTEGVKMKDMLEFIREHLGDRFANDVNRRTNTAKQEGNLQGDHKAVTGLIQVIIMYIKKAQVNRAGDRALNGEGPKTFFRLMARSDFHSMYNSLSGRDKTRFRQVAFGGQARIEDTDNNNNPFSRAMGLALDDRVFRNGYYGFDDDARGRKRRSRGPTLREWLKSVVAPAADAGGKDKMSPPHPIAGVQDGEAREDAYSMGSYEMDGKMALLEMRGLRSKFGRQPSARWFTFAQGLYDNAAARNSTLKSRGGCCFLTTACVSSRGLPDDCKQLTVLRAYRDTYLREEDEGLVEFYYQVAPFIVESIDRSARAVEEYERIFHIVNHCVSSIEQGKNEYAKSVYVMMTLVLADEYLEDWIFDDTESGNDTEEDEG